MDAQKSDRRPPLLPWIPPVLSGSPSPSVLLRSVSQRRQFLLGPRQEAVRSVVADDEQRPMMAGSRPNCCSGKQTDPTTLSPRYPLFFLVRSISSSSRWLPRCPPPLLRTFSPAGTRRAKWKRHHPSAPSPRPRPPPRGLDPAFSSRARRRGAPGRSRRRPRPAPSPPPARRWWSPARHRRRPRARPPPRTPRSTAPAASAAPALPVSSRCESR